MSFSSMTDQQKADIAGIIAGIRARNGDGPETTPLPSTSPIEPVRITHEVEDEFVQMQRWRAEREREKAADREKRLAEFHATLAAGPKYGRLDTLSDPKVTSGELAGAMPPLDTTASEAEESEAAPQTLLPALPVAPLPVEIDADDAETEGDVDFSKSDVGDLDVHMNSTEWSKTLHEYPRHWRHSRDANDWDQNEGFPTPLMRAGADAPEEGQVPSPQAALPPAALEGNIAVGEMRADADDAEIKSGVTSPSPHPNNAMPDTARLAYASIQIYHKHQTLSGPG